MLLLLIIYPTTAAVAEALPDVEENNAAGDAVHPDQIQKTAKRCLAEASI